ncbi:MAG: sulfatase [Candidatus Coatesbacteria bacterium]|nr:MAG: sulfatase [Candidatus Coatesbacteria bacterium]
MTGRKIPIVGFLTGASLTGGLIGAWEAAALVAFDAELTTSARGAALLVLLGLGLGAAAAGLAATAFALFRRTRPGRFLCGERTVGPVIAVAAALVFYAGYYLNVNVLPGKLHPLSLAVDVALLVLAWAFVRFGPRLRFGFGAAAVISLSLAVGAVAAAIGAAGGSRRLEPPAAEPPPGAANLLLITMDTTRADRLGAYGGPPGLTPHLDALAARSRVFRHAYCPMPLTGPSHATLLTGRTPRELGVVQNGMPLQAKAPTLAETLRAQGYRTGAVVAAFPVSSKLGFGRGFEYFDDDFAVAGAATRLTWARLAGSLGLVDVKARLQRPADEVTDRAVAWLAAEENRPFFLWVHYFDPHTPYDPPPAFRDVSNAADPHVRRYEGEVAFMDAEIGRLLGALDQAGLRDNTFVVAVADHGESLGEHDYYYDHGRYVYEPSMRLPLIVAAPPSAPCPCMRSLFGEPAVDVTKPLPLGALHGFILRTLGSNAKRPDYSKLERNEVYGESWEGDLHYQMIVAAGGEEKRLFKLILEPRTGDVELYDLLADPAETENLASSQPRIVDDLRRRLVAYFAAQPPLASADAADAETKEKLRSLGYM